MGVKMAAQEAFFICGTNFDAARSLKICTAIDNIVRKKSC